MKRTTRLTPLMVVGLISAAGLAGCVPGGYESVSTEVAISSGPPAPRVEYYGVAPGPGFVWVTGYYRWDSGAYLWMPGRWERPPRSYHRWEAGRWERRGNHWRYRQGRWRR